MGKSISVIDVEPHPSASMDLTCSLAAAGKLNYKLAMNNFLAATINFFKPSGKLTTLTSAPLEQSFDTTKEYSMKIVCSNAKFRSLAQINQLFSGSDVNNPWAGDMGSIVSASYAYNPPTLVMYARTGSDPTTRSDYYGSSFGPPCARIGYLGTFSKFLDATDGIVMNPNFSSASYEPYTPSYYNGYSEIKLTYRPKFAEVSMADLISELTQSFDRLLTGKGLYDEGTSGWHSDIRNDVAFYNRQQLTASLNFLQIAKQKDVTFDE